MPRKPEYKPLLYTTTIRNPERFKDFMHILKRFNGRILNNKTVELFERELFKVGLYRPMKRPETVQDKWKSTKNGELASKPLTDEETKDVYQQNDPQVNKSIKGHQERRPDPAQCPERCQRPADLCCFDARYQCHPRDSQGIAGYP